MSDEIEGRINALSLALEIALKELYTLRFGEAKKTVNVATADIDRLMRTAQKILMILLTKPEPSRGWLRFPTDSGNFSREVDMPKPSKLP